MKNKGFTIKTKNKCMLICFSTFLLCSIFALLSSPLLIAVIGFLSLVLGVLTFKKKTVEEKDALAKIEELKKLQESGAMNGKE